MPTLQLSPVGGTQVNRSGDHERLPARVWDSSVHSRTFGCRRQLISKRHTAASPSRGIFVTRAASSFALPDLDYDYSALEPYISGEIMELHHSRHHATYVSNFNKALEQLADAESNQDAAKLISLQGALTFNGGGHVNHTIFWKNLCPNKEYTPPSGQLLAAIKSQWGSLDAFIEKFNAATAAVQGSGWGWLGYNKASGMLEIATSFNQGTLAPQGLVPLLGVDVWEHAYYLQYKNKRPDYLNAVWNVVNWKDVAQRYTDAKGK